MVRIVATFKVDVKKARAYWEAWNRSDKDKSVVAKILLNEKITQQEEEELRMAGIEFKVER